MKRKYPENWTDAIKKIKSDTLRIADLIEQVDRSAKERDELSTARREALGEARAARNDAEEVRRHFADLKERLSKAETEVARLGGYLERVREDDNVADPLVEVEDEHGRRMISKRRPSKHHSMRDHIEDCRTMSMGAEKRKHWTSY